MKSRSTPTSIRLWLCKTLKSFARFPLFFRPACITGNKPGAGTGPWHRFAAMITFPVGFLNSLKPILIGAWNFDYSPGDGRTCIILFCVEIGTSADSNELILIVVQFNPCYGNFVPRPQNIRTDNKSFAKPWSQEINAQIQSAYSEGFLDRRFHVLTRN
jgi:hypothetical protein